MVGFGNERSPCHLPRADGLQCRTAAKSRILAAVITRGVSTILACAAVGLAQAPAKLLAHLQAGALRGETLTVDDLSMLQVGRGRSAILQASSKKRRLVAVFDDASGKQPPVLVATHTRHGSLWMRPGKPALGDLDGDGVPEALLRYETALADRVVVTAMVLRRHRGTWRVLPHPPLFDRLKPHLERKSGPLAEGKFVRVEVGETSQPLRGLYGGGGFLLVQRPGKDRGQMSLLVTVILRDAGKRPSYRVAASMFRLGPKGFAPDPQWNRGRLLVQPIPVPLRAFDPATLAKIGWPRR